MLGILINYFKKTTRIKSTLPPASYKASLDTSPHPKSLSLYFKKINRVKNKLDGQPSSLLACMHYKVLFAPVRLVFLEIDSHHCYLVFKLFDENNNAVIPKTFYLQLLNKLVYTTTKQVKFIKI